MIVDIKIHEKSFGHNVLYNGLEFDIRAGEKLGLIGRNGTGKTTLLNIITGLDKDFDGEVNMRKGLVVVSSRQEHYEFEDRPVIDYICSDLPEFAGLKHLIDSLPASMGSDTKLISKYTDALDRFAQLGYYDVEDDIEQAFSNYQIDPIKMLEPLKKLSGGQKRLVELIKVQRARADLALIDEPTNHMDYVAKDGFIKWMEATKDAVVVISHDRDVLRELDRIIEIRDGKADIFNGNYDDYIRINASRTSGEINEYGVTQSRIRNLKEDVIRFQRLKEKARNPGTIQRFKRLEQRSRHELAELQKLQKPSFWIDQESVETLNPKLTDAYDKHKAKNIRIDTKTKDTRSSLLLIKLEDLSLGYDFPLFDKVSLQIRERDRIEIKGRNGAGKTTLVNAVLATANQETPTSKVYSGYIEADTSLRIGNYEQEIEGKYLEKTLASAIELAYRDRDLKINGELIKQKLSEYLFNPISDGNKKLSILSGGQKARFQLICMLAGDPNVLILDEPTNHLDLPSIEELENALNQYHGAIIYISHDSYFTSRLGGSVFSLSPTT